MPAGNLVRRKNTARQSRDDEQQRQERSRPPGNDDEDLNNYIEKFIANGLRLQSELMVNHQAIEAAKSEYRAEFQRKRQLSR